MCFDLLNPCKGQKLCCPTNSQQIHVQKILFGVVVPDEINCNQLFWAVRTTLLPFLGAGKSEFFGFLIPLSTLGNDFQFIHLACASVSNGLRLKRLVSGIHPLQFFMDTQK